MARYEVFDGWDLLGLGLGLAGGVLAVGLVLIGLAALWFALLGVGETPRARPF